MENQSNSTKLGAVVGIAVVALGAISLIFREQLFVPRNQNLTDRQNPTSSSPEESSKTEVTTSPSVPAISPSITASQTVTYKNGTYTATGTYRSPNDIESVEVKIVIENNAIKSVQVTPKATFPQSRSYQTLFSQGISQKVVGKNIDEITSLGNVNGSSLTGIGFLQALATIKNEAKG